MAHLLFIFLDAGKTGRHLFQGIIHGTTLMKAFFVTSCETNKTSSDVTASRSHFSFVRNQNVEMYLEESIEDLIIEYV